MSLTYFGNFGCLNDAEGENGHWSKFNTASFELSHFLLEWPQSGQK